MTEYRILFVFNIPDNDAAVLNAANDLVTSLQVKFPVLVNNLRSEVMAYPAYVQPPTRVLKEGTF